MHWTEGYFISHKDTVCKVLGQGFMAKFMVLFSIGDFLPPRRTDKQCQCTAMYKLYNKVNNYWQQLSKVLSNNDEKLSRVLFNTEIKTPVFYY